MISAELYGAKTENFLSYTDISNVSTTKIDSRLTRLLEVGVKMGASDLHIQSNNKPHFRIDEQLRPVKMECLSEEDTKTIILSTIDEKTQDVLDQTYEIDYALFIPNVGRFRVNTFKAGGLYEMVIRLVVGTPKTSEELRLPSTIIKVTDFKDGLVLVAGPTGSGKSTTLAAMIDSINRNKAKRIITIENPIEIVHQNDKSFITQREIGIDTKTFAYALRSVLRQDPDVIMVGEIRDRETADAAIQAAQTGHLVLSTIHAGNSSETIDRLTNLYPPEDRRNVRDMLASVLRGVFVQHLVSDIKGKMIPAVEVLANDLRVQEYLRSSGEQESLNEILESGGAHDMQTMDSHLVDLVVKKVITPETAINSAQSIRNVKQKLKSLSFM